MPPTESISIPPLQLRAAVVPSTWDPKTRELDLEFASTTRVLNFDCWGEPFEEQLDLSPGSVRLDRLNSNGPVLDSHGQQTHRGGTVPLKDMLGTVVDASVDGSKGHCRIRILDVEKTADVRAMFDQGVTPGVSAGYRVHQYRDITTAEDNMRVLLAVDWEPFEITLVPIPADFSVGLRSLSTDTKNDCAIEGRQAMPPITPEEKAAREKLVKDERARCIQIRSLAAEAGDKVTPKLVDTWINGGTAVDEVRSMIEGLTVTAPTPTPDGGGSDPAGDLAEATQTERTRSTEIYRIGHQHTLDQKFVDKHLADGTELGAFRALVIDQLADGADKEPNQRSQGGVVEVGEEEATKRLRGLQGALHLRAGIQERNDAGVLVPIAMCDEAKEFRGVSLLETCREVLELRGIRTRGIPKKELVKRAMLHTSADFNSMLANTGNKMLRNSYEAAPKTWLPLGKRIDATDFKDMTRHQLGDAPSLLPVGESGEIEHGSMGEATESYAVATFARIVALTRQAIINDDLGAFTRINRAFGRAAADRESAIVWGLITGNAVMGDGLPIFDAGHNNTGTGVISIAGLTQGDVAMGLQKGVPNKKGEEQFINAMPTWLVVPLALKSTGEQFIANNIVPTEAGKVNPFSGRLQLIAEPRLDADSAAQWYMTSDPNQVEVVEYAYLDGVTGPTFDTEEGFNVDGVAFKASLDFGAVVLDFRGLYRSSGV